MTTKRTAVVAYMLVGLGVLASAQAPPKPATPERVVYLAGALGYEDLVVFTTCLAASGKPGVVLLDSPKTAGSNQEFLKQYQPERVVVLGSFPRGIPDLEARPGFRTAPVLEWKGGMPTALWKDIFPKAERVVVCPPQPRRLFLQAAYLAGVLGAPLYVTHGEAGDAADLRRRLADWTTRDVFAIAAADQICRDIPGVTHVALADEKAVAAACREHQLKKGSINTLVVANPADADRGGMSALAPWIALQRRALLLLTNEAGTNCADLVQTALKDQEQIQPEFLMLVASLKAIPMEKRPNPVPGKDLAIEMEPLTPAGDAPFRFATGRLFHEEPALVALMLARQRLLEKPALPRKALIVSNPGNSLPLMETFSRHTHKELRNNGYETTALFGRDVSPAKMRRLMPEHDIFLWEGHYKTLIEDYEFLTWTEPLRPSLIYLQSCLALKETEADPLFQRGAVAVVGTSTRTYSGSGGAITLAFFDAMLYDDLPLGSSLRQAKNFMLAYSLLKQKRLDGKTQLAGVNVRSAWAFSLWGDPTLKLPRPERPADALPHVRHEVKDNTLVIHIPEKTYETVVVRGYEARIRPNARLAGLVNSAEDGKDRRSLVPLAFAEVKLPQAPAGKVPRLTGREPERNWVFLWDGQRSCGYLLAVPGSKRKLSFEIAWE